MQRPQWTGEPMIYAPPDGFKLVYQGGHHNVYCDGRRHIWTTGGFTALSQVMHLRDGWCDCKTWRADSAREQQ